MPISIPNDLPASSALKAEGMSVLHDAAAVRRDVWPLRIGLINLMPDKLRAELQVARLLGATPLQVELVLIRITDYCPRNSTHQHLGSFYRAWSDVRRERFDGVIITGAPVEKMPFEDVSYWDELRRIFDWTQTNVFASLNICWAAQAAIYHFHRIEKKLLPNKIFGVFSHCNLAPTSPYLRGFADDCYMPASRWSETCREGILKCGNLKVLMDSPEIGICLLEDPEHRSLHLFNHIEYDSESLRDEYIRDSSNGVNVNVPQGYFPSDNPSLSPLNRWRGHAHLLVNNWINEIYQATVFDVTEIGGRKFC
jgi:homoserine O-succinyltransferase/O-acetyltransferase